MQIQPLRHPSPNPRPKDISFGILKGYRKIPYGEYTWGEYKDYHIRIIDYSKYDQKLIYVSYSKLHKWIMSKLTYVQNGIRKVMRSKAK